MRKLLTIFAVLTMAASAYAEEDVMKFAYSESFAPYSWMEDGRMRGILIDIADEAVGKRMGVAVSHHGYPWERAQHLVRKGELDAHITNGPNRKAWADHSKETILKHEMKVYVKAGGDKIRQLEKIGFLEALRPFKLVDHRGNGWAKNHLVDKDFDVHMVADQEAMYRLLAKGRVDANINTSYVARYVIKKLGLQEQIVELPVGFDPLPFHLVVGKKSPFTKIIPKSDEIIREMKKDGSLEKIFDKYR